MSHIREICESCFDEHRNDCSGFVRAVAGRLGLTVTGLANEIVATLRTDSNWTRLPNGAAAAQSALDGKLVVAGLAGSEQTHPDAHGHVVVVVDGPLAHGVYPTAYWGSLGGEPGRNQTINWSWTAADLPHVIYAAHDATSAE